MGRLEAPMGRLEAPMGRLEAPMGRLEAPMGRLEAQMGKCEADSGQGTFKLRSTSRLHLVTTSKQFELKRCGCTQIEAFFM